MTTFWIVCTKQVRRAYFPSGDAYTIHRSAADTPSVALQAVLGGRPELGVIPCEHPGLYRFAVGGKPEALVIDPEPFFATCIST